MSDDTISVERAVIGACFLDASAATLALQNLRPEHFESDHAQLAFRAIQRHAPEGGSPDLVFVVEDLRSDPNANGAVAYTAHSPAGALPSNQAAYVAHVLRRWIAREERDAAAEIAGAVSAEVTASGHRRMAEVEKVRLRLTKPLDAVSTTNDSWDMVDLLQEADDPPPDEFVSRLFVRPSFNVVFGPPQAGKSWAVMGGVLDAVMGSGNFLGCEDLYIKPLREIRDGRQERVLWVFGSEDTRARVKRRLKTLHESGPHAGKEIPRGAMTIATPPGGLSIHLPAGWDWLVAKITEVNPSIVVLDTIASLTGSTLDVKKDEQVVPFIAKINALRSERNLIVFGLHHTRKGSSDTKKGSEAKADSMLGSQAWRALSEGVLMLDAPDGDTSKVTVISVKAKDIDRPIPKLLVTLESPGGRFRQLDEEEAVPQREEAKKGRKPSVTADQILALRERFPDGLKWSQVRDELDVNEKTWRNNSTRLQDEIVKKGHVFFLDVLKWEGA